MKRNIMQNAIPKSAYQNLPLEIKGKYDLLAEKFRKIFNQDPIFFARAPGRVNLIGEHIDYCGYSVLPMAIEFDIAIAASANDENILHLSNFEDCFKPQKIKTDSFEISINKPQWHDYFLSGYKGILDKFNLDHLKGLNICVYGQLPKSAGLSSSSALVVCAALTTLYANQLTLSQTELADLCASSERYVGTQGGGMDQAISCLAEEGSAKLIDFNPLRVTNVSLPKGSQFVITNSCVEANKAASNYFNTRVAECRLFTQILAKSQGLEWRKIKKPLELQKILSFTLLEMIDLVESKLHSEDYTIEEIFELLETTHDEIVLNCLNQNTANLKHFQLYKRALHVYSEAQRVNDFRDACSLNPEVAFEKLGKLMNESHESCKSLYDCSCAELDELTEICRKAGAYGSRLTGAGWGGCVVSLVPRERVKEFFETVKQDYYSKNPRLEILFEKSVFSTAPSSGISIITP